MALFVPDAKTPILRPSSLARGRAELTVCETTLNDNTEMTNEIRSSFINFTYRETNSNLGKRESGLALVFTSAVVVGHGTVFVRFKK